MINRNRYNLNYMKEIREFTDKELIQAFKEVRILNMNLKYSLKNSFQKKYNTLLFELDRRGLLK